LSTIATKKAVAKKAASKSIAKKAVKKAPAKKVAVRKPKTEAVAIPAELEQTPSSEQAWREVVLAIQEKQGRNIRVLDLREVTSFTDFFIITNGSNMRQNMAICDEVEGRLKREMGDRPTNIEGYNAGEWILMDYGDYIVHIFSEEKRSYYDLERLYRTAKITEISDPS
jgi:ribosome-associated protein